MKGLEISYDCARDVLTVEGQDYSGAVFRALGTGGLAPGAWIRIEERRNGTLTIYTAHRDEVKAIQNAYRLRTEGSRKR